MSLSKPPEIEDDLFEKMNAIDKNHWDRMEYIMQILKNLNEKKIYQYNWLFVPLKKINHIKMNEHKSDEDNKNCEYVLAEYLYDVMKKLKRKYINKIMIFINAYKEAADKYCWDAVNIYESFSHNEKSFVEKCVELCSAFTPICK